jgi:hypothetical protein
MSESKDRPAAERREFSRTTVQWPAWIKPLDDEKAAALDVELRLRPSVWEPQNEETLRQLAYGSGGGHNEALLARAILDLTAEIVRLRAQLADPDRELRQVDVVELSRGGGRLITPLLLRPEDRLEIRFEPIDEGMPPVRALIRIVHRFEGPDPGFGFAYEAIHPHDRDRIDRLIDQARCQTASDGRYREDAEVWTAGTLLR